MNISHIITQPNFKFHKLAISALQIDGPQSSPTPSPAPSPLQINLAAVLAPVLVLLVCLLLATGGATILGVHVLLTRCVCCYQYTHIPIRPIASLCLMKCECLLVHNIFGRLAVRICTLPELSLSTHVDHPTCLSLSAQLLN